MNNATLIYSKCIADLSRNNMITCKKEWQLVQGVLS